MLIKYIKSVLWRVAKCLSYIQEARCLKVKRPSPQSPPRDAAVNTAILWVPCVTSETELESEAENTCCI